MFDNNYMHTYTVLYIGNTIVCGKPAKFTREETIHADDMRHASLRGHIRLHEIKHLCDNIRIVAIMENHEN